MKILSGKTVLITGASRGIGREIAAIFAQEGANLFLTYNKTPLDETLKLVSANGGKVESEQLDVSSADGAGAVVKKCIDALGSVDVLINNAGVNKDALLMRMKDSDWDEVLNTNLKGAFNMIKAVSRPMMKQRSGKIINIGSVIGFTGNAGQANYAASKAGMMGLTKSASRELASRNINVNLIAPGYIETEMTDNLDEKTKKEILSNIPVKRFGQARDVADAAIFLASPESDYMTGQAIHVNGGLYM